MTVIRSWPDLLSGRTLKRLAGRACGKRQGRTNFADKLEKMAAFAESGNLLRPETTFRRIGVSEIASDHLILEGGESLRGIAGAKQRFAGASEIVVCVQTLGQAIDQAIADLFSARKMAEMMALEEIAIAASFALSESLHRAVAASVEHSGLDVGSPLSPGDAGFAFTAQRKLHALADAGRIGVTLTRSGMLAPVKSLSSVIALGDNVPTWDRTDSCSRCGAAAKCRFRVGKAASLENTS